MIHNILTQKQHVHNNMAQNDDIWEKHQYRHKYCSYLVTTDKQWERLTSCDDRQTDGQTEELCFV